MSAALWCDKHVKNRAASNKMSQTIHDEEERRMSEVIEINVSEAKNLLSEHENLLLLDKRDVQSYRQECIEGALMAHDELVESLIRKGDKTAPVLIYCYHGISSLELGKLFAGFGFKKVYSMAGGYAEWKRAHAH